MRMEIDKDKCWIHCLKVKALGFLNHQSKTKNLFKNQEIKIRKELKKENEKNGTKDKRRPES